MELLAVTEGCHTWVYAVVGTVVLFVMVLWRMRAPVPKGVPLISTFEPFWGTTRDMKATMIDQKLTTPPLYNLAEFYKNGFKAFGWGHFGGRYGVVVVEPEDVKFLLKDNFNNFVKSKEFIDIFHPLFGSGIFNANGEQWKEQRIVASHMFNRRQLRERMSDVFGTHAQEMVQVLTKGTVNIQTIFYHYTFDCINSIAFNREVNSLKGNAKDCAFQAAFDKLQNEIVTRFYVPWWKIHRYFQSSSQERLIQENLKISAEYMDGVVDSYYDENGAVKEQALLGDQTLTGLFLEYARSESKTYSRAFIRDMILNFVVAGRDTTGSALTSCIEYLCKHPEWQEKLIAEAKACFGGSKQEALTFDDIEDKSPIAEAVFLEALRLHPSVPGNEKVALEKTRFPSGVEVEAGAHVSWVPIATNRYKKVWGEDAEEFNPSRWLGDKAANYDDYMYPTFNAGPRLCLGKNMAILEGKIALLTLFAHYRFAAVPGFVPKVVSSVTWQLENGLEVEAIPL
eukprot:TRINITY_DN655_c1_g1_i1.p1 TRINITY_DN655_c1_g1~~TRINITY_DN655_c1_g1_i1.p1  ORF type:complete len:510 (+),score=217.76 TRINITY_DN655_c1_g1_i1:112-1641(+)